MFKKTTLKTALLISVFTLLSCKANNEKISSITPRPVETTIGQGYFTISPNIVISIENEEQEKIASLFCNLIKKSTGINIGITKNNPMADIKFTSDSSAGKDGAYKLEVTPKRIDIKASSLSGFYYALQTIRLSLPAYIESEGDKQGQFLNIQTMKITDAPRFEYRGLMLDVARYFMPLNDVKELIDCMSMLKLNKLHLHLSDDTGWRLEIKKYPKLTEVGAWRVDRRELPFYERRNQEPDEQATVGGFYTQKDIKELVAYASERQVEIIPEIDVPAHSCAALASYPELACPNVKKTITVLPGLGGRDTEIIYCAGNEKTFQFINNIIDEISELFPSQYIHIGGDEANKTYWKSCPLCQKRMKKEGITHVENLQGYFMKRVNEHIKSKNKTMIGWDELTNSELPDGTVVMGWQGYGNAALKAAAKGHKFIMTPARLLYLIRYQGPQWFEPLTYFGNNTLKDVYNYEPVQDNWDEKYANLLWGIQASMWTEFCDNTDAVMHQIFPRLVALAEVAWSEKGKKDWNTFQLSLDNYLSHLDAKHIKYAHSMFNIQHKSIPTGKGIKVSLDCERTDVNILYTTDGSEPTKSSNVYSDTLHFNETTILKAATFKNNVQTGKTLSLDLKFNKATGKLIAGSNNEEALLTNGVRGSLRQSDFEWCTWYNPINTFVLDLNQRENIHKVTITCLTNYGMGVHKPRCIKLEVSDNTTDFKVIGERKFSDKDIFKEGNFTEDICFELKDTEARFVRFSVESAGKIPSFHFMRPGQISKFYIDEISIE